MQGTAAGNGQPAAQSQLRELRQRARSACFVPVIRKTQNNRNFTLSRKKSLTRQKLAKKRGSFIWNFLMWWFCAVGETRTRTGLLPLPPQSSVSTISPPPLLLFWDCKGTTKILNSKFFFTFFAKIFTFLFRQGLGTHSTHSFSVKSLYSHFYLLSLRAFPRVGKHGIIYLTLLKQIHNGC